MNASTRRPDRVLFPVLAMQERKPSSPPESKGTGRCTSLPAPHKVFSGWEETVLMKMLTQNSMSCSPFETHNEFRLALSVNGTFEILKLCFAFRCLALLNSVSTSPFGAMAETIGCSLWVTDLKSNLNQHRERRSSGVPCLRDCL